MSLFGKPERLIFLLANNILIIKIFLFDSIDKKGKFYF